MLAKLCDACDVGGFDDSLVLWKTNRILGTSQDYPIRKKAGNCLRLLHYTPHEFNSLTSKP